MTKIQIEREVVERALDALDEAEGLADDCAAERAKRRFIELRALLRTALAAAPPGWIACSERMPEQVGEYLIAIRTKSTGELDVTAMWWDGRAWEIGGPRFSADFAEFWMPMPEPPTPGSGS